MAHSPLSGHDVAMRTKLLWQEFGMILDRYRWLVMTSLSNPGITLS